MAKDITVVPSDKIIIIDGDRLEFEFSAPANVHALQWHNGKGHIEYNDGQVNLPLATEKDFARNVQSYVDAWMEEKVRINAEEEKAKAAAEAKYNSPLEVARRELAEKEAWLSEHDYIGIKIATGRATAEDYPTEIAMMKEYAIRIEELRTIITELSTTDIYDDNLVSE